MEEFLFTINEWMSQTYGRNDTYGWVYVLLFIASVFGGFQAKELVKKRSSLRQKQIQTARKRDLEAVLVTEEDGKEVKYLGVISRSANSLAVTIRKETEEESETVVNQTAETMEEVSDFLRQKTKFILADFK